MRKTLPLLIALFALLALAASCGGGGSQQAPADGAATSSAVLPGEDLKPVEDSRPAAYVVRNPTWLYDITGEEFAKYKKDLIFGEKLYLLGDTAKKATKKGGAVLDWVKVKRELGGEEGWAIDLHLVKGTLGIVVAEAAVYNLPDNAALAKTKVPVLTFVAITEDPTAGSFYKVSWYDQVTGVWTKDKYLKQSTVSIKREDYKSAQQLILARGMGDKDKAIKIELLTTAQADYAGSAFAMLIAEDLMKLQDTTPATVPVAGGERWTAVDSANVYDVVPADAMTASVAYTLTQGEECVVIEQSAETVSFDGQNGNWYKVQYTDSGNSKTGWVFSPTITKVMATE